MPSSTSPNFKQLFDEENTLLFQADKKEKGEAPMIEPPGPAGEPWVSYASVDRVGLAFSGGGIRSATFNLGILKALHKLDVLKHVDYLSTVSGGGYTGAWWTAWRARWGNATKEFPVAHCADGDGQDTYDEKLNREPEEVRHLREFSNFLSPRIGFFQSEMWNAVMAVVSAVLPAVLTASSVLALAFLLWLAVNKVILDDLLSNSAFVPWLGWHAAPVLLLLITIFAYVAFEIAWVMNGKAEPLPTTKWRFGIVCLHLLLLILLVLGVIFGWQCWVAIMSWANVKPPEVASEPLWKWGTGITGIPGPDGSRIFSFSRHLFAGPILGLVIAGVLLIPRLLLMRFAPVSVSSKVVSVMDRALSRLIGVGVVFAAVGILWLAGCWLNATNWGTKIPAGGALLSGGAFALLRNWMGRLGPAKKGGVMDLLKPLLPQILAYIAIALWAICIAALLARGFEKNLPFWLIAGIPFGVVVFAALFFDPAQVSMHSFYRNRLARAYLGASNVDAKERAVENRQTDVRVNDDIQLRDLSRPGAERPIHLVCCAANDLGGDHLENLSRGSRSAVLSKFGFAIGDCYHTWEGEKRDGKESLGLSSAITASAAAFNSNMGSISITLGAGVTFLCTGLNLRLGLWLPHPVTNKDGPPSLMPGLLFFREMFGLTHTERHPRTGKPFNRYVHLSDGAHFENLGLYELVRRHCRYIIVSDCGADPQVAFDDFGNAVRRIREDFGVEIEIDLSPLKPNPARLSRQHVAVGIITYDPRGDRRDTAVLLYFKPTLTGDEPSDIAQYRTRNQDFPHESTGDQFYDEAQWESYRRLGEHAANAALRFVEHEKRENLSPDTIFNGARWEWYQSLEQREEKILELTGRLTALEEQLRQDAPARFVDEMYPELRFLDGKSGKENGAAKSAGESAAAAQPSEATPEEIGTILHFLTQMIQLMEDVWFACSLDTHWTDPNNLGWINLFQRWAYTPSFRLWWPILKPMHGRKFRRFMEERLSLADEDYPKTLATVRKHDDSPELPKGVAQLYWKRMHATADKETAGKKIYLYELHLTQQREEGDDLPRPIQAGLAFIDLSDDMARWNVEHLFIPPSLWGAGLGERFLNQLLAELKKAGCKSCEVTVETPVKKPDDKDMDWSKRTDPASRQQLNDLLAFYQRAQFNFDQKSKTLTRIL